MRFLIVNLLLVTAWAAAGERVYLKKSERFCDRSGVFCVRGTLFYDVNPRLLGLNARVQKAPGPGLLRIRVSGSNRQGHRRLATLEVNVRGRSSEIIDRQMIPDAPDVYAWTLDSIAFVAEAPD